MAQEYDNYYGDGSSYSKYPTDDKRYECRTGPFEGFFVSSVEFCKHVKFDKDDKKDIRDNRTGTQGLQVHKVHLGLPEKQEQQVHKEIKVFKVYKVKEDLMERKVLQVLIK